MREYGLDPDKVEDAAWPEGSIGNFVEAHIEQGPVLDQKNIEIGLVTGIVGIQRYMVKVYGRADHAGTTPMNLSLIHIYFALPHSSPPPCMYTIKASMEESLG